MKKSTRGFTIVELLIVIVVIAILAAISILAYNGIQQRAINTQIISAAKTYKQAFDLYSTQNGQLPLGQWGASANYCLGHPRAICINSSYWDQDTITL